MHHINVAMGRAK